jgi:hypothetical protein
MHPVRTILAVLVTSAWIASPALAQQAAPANAMSFFVTSAGPGKGGNLGGLIGADRHCQMLATAAGAGGKMWHAYLSENGSAGHASINARDRIGSGPWYNARGVMIASSVADLHSDNNKISKQTALTEKGDVVNGRTDMPNRHDMLTGSQPDGTAYPGADSANTTCGNWVRYFPMSGKVRLGHHDRDGNDPVTGKSWNSSHDSMGCSQDELKATGGDGLFYCFAVN